MIIARTERLLAAAATAAGLAAWVVFLRADLVLSHYDAKAHLVVARRVFDNITPGWKQIGAVWLPLPHLINLLPTQIDFFYRTGVFASAVSIVCFTITVWAAARLVLGITGSRAGAITAAALLALNPNLLYLQATPMTEPLLLATTFVAVLWLFEWVRADRHDVPARLAWALMAAAWSRYEAWPILCAALAAAAYAIWRRTGSLTTTMARTARVAIGPLVAVLAFFAISRATVGRWFVTGGFFVEDPLYVAQPLRDLFAVWWGTHRLSGYAIETVAVVTAVMLVMGAARAGSASPDLAYSVRRAGAAVRRTGRGIRAGAAMPDPAGVGRCPDDAALLIPVALLSCVALPVYAFYDGHPFRIRYMIPAVAACALFCGLAVGLLARRRAGRVPADGRGRGARLDVLLMAVLIGSTLVESPPWRGDAPMLEEAQWDVPFSAGRRAVTACLVSDYHGEKILASMASLAHYMQELSHQGFALADFLNEGNGVLWNLAMETGPASHTGWMLVEERAEGGDVLAQRIRLDSSFTRGMIRVCEGGGVALYRRVP